MVETPQVRLTVHSPAVFRRRASGLTVWHGHVDSPFGPMLLAFSDEGICLLQFVRPDRDERAVIDRHLPGIRLERDSAGAARHGAGLFEPCADGLPVAWTWGTSFQAQVWRTLAQVPPGRVISYGGLAARVGRPGAARAVGTAMARNPLAWLVPCHRVVRSDGSVGSYQGGSERKAAMLAWERSWAVSKQSVVGKQEQIAGNRHGRSAAVGEPSLLDVEPLIDRAEWQGAMADQQYGPAL